MLRKWSGSKTASRLSRPKSNSQRILPGENQTTPLPKMAGNLVRGSDPNFVELQGRAKHEMAVLEPFNKEPIRRQLAGMWDKFMLRLLDCQQHSYTTVAGHKHSCDKHTTTARALTAWSLPYPSERGHVPAILGSRPKPPSRIFGFPGLLVL